jgi:hypothetical protein
MKRLLSQVLLLSSLLLVGCATTQNYEKVLDTWVGAKETELVSNWGVPDGFYESGSTKYLTYKNSSSGYVEGTPANYTTTIVGGMAYTTSSGGTSGYSYNYNCDTTFSIRNGTISSWSYKGNNCVAFDPDD